MPTLSEQFDTSLGDIDVSVSVDGEVQKLIIIAQLIAQLIDNPPDEFSDYLQLLAEIDLPDFEFAGELGTTFGTLQDLIPGDISELNAGLLENLDQLELTAVDGVSGSIQPAIEAINAFMTLFKGDITCGLIDGFMGGTGQRWW